MAIQRFLYKTIILGNFLIQPALASEFFYDISNLIINNEPRMSYGVAVTDLDKDGSFEFIVTGFKYDNLALSYEDGNVINIVNNELFSDKSRSTIGVASCDIDGDGFEEIYFLNTDTFSGQKIYSDRILDNFFNFIDLFEFPENIENSNFTAGRSVACVDVNGDGVYSIYVSNYGGPTRMYTLSDNRLIDSAPEFGINNTTGGRAIVSGHILSEYMDIFAANERGPNFLFRNTKNGFKDVAVEYNVDDTLQNGRGTTLSDIHYKGNLDIITGNWKGFHRIYTLMGNSFADISSEAFKQPSNIRTIISADFDNDGYDEIFLNNLGQGNKLFKILRNGELKEISLTNALESKWFGTGAAVADIDNDGILELLISHGETSPQPLSLFKAKVVDNAKYLRIIPLTTNFAPARGATVILNTNMRNHAKTIDAGSGYLCQMEPVAHYGIRKEEKILGVTIKWTNGTSSNYEISDLNKTYIFQQY